MLFNSVDFALFLPIVFLLYWFAANKGLFRQNLVIVLASYFFYGWWDWRFLALILFSTTVDFFIGIALHSESQEKRRHFLLWTSIIVNIGLLGVFKYCNFFLENIVEAFSFFGVELSIRSLNFILPVGISFYTFQTLSYTIDVYKRKIEPTHSFIAFAAFVSFFPQLVAGPIERATNFLPQFYQIRSFDYNKSVDGLRQILWGVFKKIVIADNAAFVANEIFNNSGDYNGSTLVLGAFFFTIQIYGDFSGYSDIAIGTARLFGFNLMQNFAFPYFSRDIAEFWRRWHISLSSWFRDYVYIPLGGSRGGKFQKIRNVFITFLISGFWHGASWTFIIWGGLNALFFLPLLLSGNNRLHLNTVAEDSFFPSFRDLFAMLTTFGLTMMAWIVFRAESIGQMVDYFSTICSTTLFEIPHFEGMRAALITLLLITVFTVIEWIGRKDLYAIENMGLSWSRPIRIGFYYLIMIAILWFGGQEQQFIYFQF